MNNTSIAGSVFHLIVLGKTDTGLSAYIEYSLVSTRNSAESESLIIDLVPVALSTDSFNGVVSNFAAALTVLQDFIDSTSQNAVALSVLSESRLADTNLVDGIEGSISFALLADVVDFEVGPGTFAHA